MDPLVFSNTITKQAALLVGKLYDCTDLPRTRVQEITTSITNLLQNDSITALFNQLLDRMLYLGESADAIFIYKTMIDKIQNPFDTLRTEHQCITYFQGINTYLPPNEVKVGKKQIFKKVNDRMISITENVTAQIINLREALKKFLELPGIFSEIISYVRYLEAQKILVTNVIQGIFWRKKKLQFGNKIVLPLFFYQDDFETNNPLGSHRGLGKMGTVYINIPCLPPQIQSKVENIFLLALYKTSDLKYVTLNAMLSTAVAELNFLETTGIDIFTSSGPQKIYFSLAGVIGDNLAVHSILGFTGSFSAKHPCRFCSINRDSLNSIFDESNSLIRTNESYSSDLMMNNSNETGVCGPSVLNDIKSSTTIDLLTIDVMHDILEGTAEYDFGLILNYFITEAKFFTLDEINNRIASLSYGADDVRNKPKTITKTQISNKHIKMSAAEMLCFIRNIGILIGDLIPVDNPHWKVCIMIKDIVDIVTSSVIHAGLCDYLQSLVSEYLQLLTTLFPGCLKPKHHFLTHYSRIMRLKGPAWNMNTMRNESMNRNIKMTAIASLTRKNISRTLAIKHQLHLNYRFLSNSSPNKDIYELGPSHRGKISSIPQFHLITNCLSVNVHDEVLIYERINFKGEMIKQDVILMIPSEMNPEFFITHAIFIDNSSELFIIAKNISDYTYYDEHYHAYKLFQDYHNSTNWKCLSIKELTYCSVTHKAVSKNGYEYILKRWI